MKNLMNISMGSVAGAGIGVAIGYYGFKQKGILPLMAFGIGGAIASGYITNAMIPKPKTVDITPQIEEDFEEPIYEENNGDIMEFNEQLGYMLPREGSQVEVTNPSDEMELSF